MATVTLTEALRLEYQRLFDSCTIRRDRVSQVEAIAGRLVAQQARYTRVAQAVGAPWYFVGVIHNMESSLNFSRHLHNGDPLTARTVHVPAGRPPHGQPPFTWEESTVDALRLRQIDRWSDWSLPGLFYQLEGYNGWGYRRYHPHVLSPYLWSFSNHYTRGKYIADGRWSETAASQQCGAAVLLRRLADRGIIDLDDWFAKATPADLEKVVRKVLNEGTAFGQVSWAGTSKATLAGLQELYNILVQQVIPGLPHPSTEEKNLSPEQP